MTTPVVVLICKTAFANTDNPPAAVAWSYMFTLHIPDGEGGYQQVQPRRRIGIMAGAGAYEVDRAYMLTPAPEPPESPVGESAQ